MDGGNFMGCCRIVADITDSKTLFKLICFGTMHYNLLYTFVVDPDETDEF